jgi:hypothetical protein
MGISAVRFRLLRATVFTALVVTLSAASHILLSRAPLPLTTVAALAAAVFAVAYPLAGTERGLGRIAGLLIPLELAADTVFTTGQHLCYGRSGGPVTGPLRSVGMDLFCGGTPLGRPLAAITAEDRNPLLELPAGPATPWVLLAAHIGVGLLAACWLRRGEAALAGLLRTATVLAFRPLLLAIATVAPDPRGPVRRPTGPAHRVNTFRDRLLAHSVGRRGPPRAAFPVPAHA